MPYFTTDEFRSLMADMNDEAKYPDIKIETARDAVEALIEDKCETSFIERTVTETVDGSGNTNIVLSSPYIQSVTTVVIDGVTQSAYTYTFADGTLQRRTTGSYTPVPWVCGVRNITVTYQAGYSTACPNDLKLAAMEATRDKVLKLTNRNNKPTSRAVSQTNEFGGITQFSVAADDKPTGIPDVDATIMRWANKVRVPSVG